MIPTKLANRIDRSIEAAQESSFRNHLGASIIGNHCSRSIWYAFRWFKEQKYSARQLRLFERGKREESVFVEHLKSAGVQVWTHDENGEQFKIYDHAQHFAGSADGFGYNLPDKPGVYFVTEFKTFANKYYRALVKQGVEKSNWNYYVQATIYAYKAGLEYFLFCAVNKDNDDLYFEFIKIKSAVAEKYLERAEYIIYSQEPPPKISLKKTFYKCKMCSFYDVCHNEETPHKNCRTCANASPRRSGAAAWLCYATQKELEDFEPCRTYRRIDDDHSSRLSKRSRC